MQDLGRIATSLRNYDEGAVAPSTQDIFKWSAAWREAIANGEIPPETTLPQFVAMQAGGK